MSNKARRFFSVQGTREAVSPYLYGHTKIVVSIVAHAEDGATQLHWQILCTTVEGDSDAAHDRATYLANYQRGRIGSGLLACGVITHLCSIAIDRVSGDIGYIFNP